MGSVTTLLALAVVVLSGPARAGVLDSPPPVLPGNEPSKVIYSMGPVYFGQNVDTVVQCTNLADHPALLALEVFDGDGVLRGELAPAAVGPNGDVTFATSATPGIPGAVILSHLPPIDHGKARVSATTVRLSWSTATAGAPVSARAAPSCSP